MCQDISASNLEIPGLAALFLLCLPFSHAFIVLNLIRLAWLGRRPLLIGAFARYVIPKAATFSI